MTAMRMYRKNLLQNQLTDGLETWGVASSIQVLQKYLNYDLDPFYANVQFGHYGFCMGKNENYFWIMPKYQISWKVMKIFAQECSNCDLGLTLSFLLQG